MLFIDYTPDLSELEYSIYNYVQRNIELVVHMRIRDLAENTHTSTASILRFCTKFECDGYAEFRLKLKYYFDEKKLDISDYKTEELISFLARSQESFISNKIKAAAEIIASKELTIFIGSGSSEQIASYGVLYFSNLSLTAVRIQDPANYPLEWFSKEILKKSVFVVLSISGETHDVLNTLNSANVSETPIISLTNSESSRLGKISDIVIPYNITREILHKKVHAEELEITSQIPAVFTIEMLGREVKRTQTHK